MTAPAAKIKAFLAAIKESLLDIDTISLEESYLTLLRLEMLQRGVLCTERDPSKILEAVRDSAGKAVLTANTSAVPKPLLAACAVMAGRSAEQGVQALQGGSSAERESLAKLLDRALLKSTTDRCKDVQEDRLATILQLSSTAMDLTDMVLQKQLLYIAEGYFYRAASFQPDAPPMWKRAWDVIQARQRLDQIEDTHVAASPWEAVTALTHLRRVAMAKGNSKRSAELSLLLAESLLNVPTEQQGDKTCIPVIQAFVAPFRPLNPLPYIQRADQAAAAMNDPSLNGAELSDDDTFLSKILAVRVGSCSEDATLKQTAQDELVLAKNRNKVGVSLEKYIFKVRRSHLATVANDLALDTSAVALRDALFAKQVTEEQNYRKRSAYSLIQCYLCRQCDIARAIGVAESEKGTNTRGWLSLVVFLEPILSAFQQKAGWDTAANLQGRQGCIQEFLGASSCAEERNLFETAAMLLPSTEWMCCGRSKHDLVLSLTLLRFAQDALSVLHNKATKLYLEVQTSSVVKSTVDAGEKAIWRLESALATTRALCALTTAGSGRPVVVAALSRVDKTDYAELNGEFGAAFFEFLRCWSGIHQTPWELCRLSEARRLIRKARACIEKATTEWGRRASPLETLLLDLGEADAEGVVFVGGMLGEASKLYNGILGASDRLSQLGSVQRDLVCSRCYTGLSSLALEQHSANSGESTAEGAEPDATARKGLHCLQQIDLSQELAPLYFWSHQGATESAVRFQIVKSRQLIADALLRNERNQDAQKMLEDAVHDAPEDAGASFAFGAFRLRLMFHGGERSSMSDKAVQIQLLKAAKLDPSKASPFALLGHWYEHFEDIKRAVGCYSKALLLDPANPVAGRGLLRLKSADDLNTILNNAINSDSSLHGWAWRAVGLQKAMIEDEDELAVVSFLKALRCRDIERPEAEPMAIFFSDPTQAWERPLEMMEVSAELAACYKRLGRYTAAIRTFHAAIDWAGDDVPPKLLCACAQSELDLGLFDDAVEKFTRALAKSSSQTQYMAAYGQGLARLSMARRDLVDGKAGAAFAHVQNAIHGCDTLDQKPGCMQKLLGDLYTFGASLPPDVFEGKDPADEGERDERQLATQHSFIASGESAYRAAENLVVAPTDYEVRVVKACLATDVGSNLLRQAQLLSFWNSKAINQVSLAPEDVFHSSAKEFRRALDLMPDYAPAWCGLGCAILNSDSLLAQHAFCRSLELNNMFPETYANLSVLYTSYDAFLPSANVSDALTQVADTPMMWINRALVLERQAAASMLADNAGKCERIISQAADAYRAALQVGKHPSAMLGLAMSCRMPIGSGAGTSNDQLESQSYITEYLGVVGDSDISVSVLSDILAMENQAYPVSLEEDSGSAEDATRRLAERLKRLEASEEMEGDSLDLDVIGKILAVEPGDGNDKAAAPSEGSSSVASQLIHEPHRGDLWLRLAKELAQKMQSTDSRQTLASAQTAARRASMMLMQELVEPSSRARTKRRVYAEDVSDALAMHHWLDSTNLKPEDDSQTLPNVKLQRSLLICPGNPIARSALGLL